MDEVFSLALPHARLDFGRQGARGYGFGLSVRTDDGNAWRAVTAPGNPLVRGSSFDLHPTDLRRRDDSTLAMSGKRRHADVEYAFTATVHADALQHWFRFEIEIDAPQPIPLAM